MRFIWFLDFWGWCRETYRADMLLRHPLEGIAANWDEWFAEEATDAERAEITRVGRDAGMQGEFLRWLGEVWIKDAVTNGNQLALHFVRSELTRVSPFDQWAAFANDRANEHGDKISAVVLNDQSKGEADDVTVVNTTLLPLGRSNRARAMVADGFEIEESDLKAARESSLRVLDGKLHWQMLARWILTGRRPYPSWLNTLLVTGWISVGLGIAWLWVGPDPGAALRPVAALLVSIWTVLVITGVATTIAVFRRARLAARNAAAHLTQDQIRFKMGRRLRLKGGSAGLPFALGILHAVARAYPESLSSSWLWRQFSHGLDAATEGWAATGIVNSNGQVQPVELTPKIHSCLKRGGLSGLLVPNQRGASNGALRRAAADSLDEKAAVDAPRKLGIHRCRDVGDAVLIVAQLSSTAQRWLGIFALTVSAVMLCAASDLRCIVFPPVAPTIVPPSSPSPYFLWVSLDTPHPAFFQVVLESQVWANRRADVALQESMPASVRAEIRLVRLSDAPAHDLQQGLVLIERRPSFLNRKFKPGEVVGRYTIPYLNGLHHD